ncbi:MAG: hypothetical protein NTV22_15970 [bacterium]|nr:hypothetical protein [bacterium]
MAIEIVEAGGAGAAVGEAHAGQLLAAVEILGRVAGGIHEFTLMKTHFDNIQQSMHVPTLAPNKPDHFIPSVKWNH